MLDHPPSAYEFSVVTAFDPIITVDGLVGKQTTNSLTGQGLLTWLGYPVPFTF